MLQKFLDLKFIAFLIKLSKQIILPGFDGLPLYNVFGSFFKGMQQGYIATRASAISFSFFLAIFPFLIFLFSIIPFIPIANFQQTLLTLIEDFMPDIVWASVQETITDIITRPRSGVLILNFFLALYFSTKGIKSLIEAFNNTYHDIESRSTIKQYIVAFALLIIISFLLIIAIGLMTFGFKILKLALPDIIVNAHFFIFLLQILRWLIILAVLFFAISFMYFLAPSRKDRFRFISAGSSLSTLLIVVTTQGFNFYMDNFSRYNALYGSIGTLLVIMLWIYSNAFVLLIGFEVNASIHVAGQDAKHGKADTRL
ncbi:MAG: YihY/virulence factor BrkB family protein [Bacteroidetes bacterium]|nr:YihY/virulence factor BrkB family protein [Bacteroidota bacterium]